MVSGGVDCRSSATLTKTYNPINQLLASIMPTPTAYSSIAAHHTGLFQRSIHGFSTVPDRFRRCFGYGQVDWGLLLRSFGGNGEAMKNFVFILFLSPPHLFRIASHYIARVSSLMLSSAVRDYLVCEGGEFLVLGFCSAGLVEMERQW